MRQSTLSAAAAGRYLGFTTSNPVLDAIAAGELPAERGPGGRNGKPGNFRIRRADLDAYARARGLELPSAAEAYESAQLGPVEVVNGEVTPLPAAPTVEQIAQPFEMIRELHIPFKSGRQQLAEPPSAAFQAGVLGVVTIPVEHYAALVAARAELAFVQANFELTWRGPSRAETVKFSAGEFGGGDARAVPDAPASATPAAAGPRPGRRRKSA